MTRELPCGATLVTREDWRYDAGIMAPGRREEVTFTLDDLLVEPGDAERLASVREDWASWLSHVLGGMGQRPFTFLSGVQVTAAEAGRLLAGEHPMAVLLPRMRARSLTRAELMRP
jgi:hypothetical protein